MAPFTARQFFGVFAAYNTAVWPMQWLLIALAAAAIVVSLTKIRRRSLFVTGILAALWLWMGLVYHLAFFRIINPAAAVFGVAFALEAALLLWRGLGPGSPEFGVANDGYAWTGAALILYALVAYPLLGVLLGHHYPATPTFGAPCPTTIFTFGVLLWCQRRVPAWLLIIPGLWALIGLSAAISLGVPEDVGLFVAGAVAIPMLVRRGRRMASLAVHHP
jgi:hypothetical protein